MNKYNVKKLANNIILTMGIMLFGFLSIGFVTLAYCFVSYLAR